MRTGNWTPKHNGGTQAKREKETAGGRNSKCKAPEVATAGIHIRKLSAATAEYRVMAARLGASLGAASWRFVSRVVGSNRVLEEWGWHCSRTVAEG